MPEPDGTLRILIRGHSSDTDELFMLNKKVTMKFLADEGHKCYTYRHDSLDLLTRLDHQSDINVYEGKHNALVNNYKIIFKRQRSDYSDGVFYIKIDENGKYSLSLSEELTPHPEDATNDDDYSVSLKQLMDYCTNVNRLYDKIEFYCIFCRGSTEPLIHQTYDADLFRMPFNPVSSNENATENHKMHGTTLKMNSRDEKMILKANTLRNYDRRKKIGIEGIKDTASANEIQANEGLFKKHIEPSQGQLLNMIPSAKRMRRGGKTTRKRRKTKITKGKKRTNLSRKRRKTKNKRR